MINTCNIDHRRLILRIEREKRQYIKTIDDKATDGLADAKNANEKLVTP
jgi:hypothetical protein